MKRKLMALMIALCLTFGALHAAALSTDVGYRIETDSPLSAPGIGVDRSADEAFEARMQRMLEQLAGEFAGEEQAACVVGDGLPLQEATREAVSRTLGTNEALADRLAALLEASCGARRTGDLFLLATPGANEGEMFFGVSDGERFAAWFAVEPDETGAPCITTQLLFTDFGAVIAQSDPEVGVLRTDASMSLLNSGTTRVALLDEATGAVLDDFEMTASPEETEATPTIFADGQPSSETTLHVGDRTQFSVVQDAAPGLCASLVRRNDRSDQSEHPSISAAVKNAVEGAKVCTLQSEPDEPETPKPTLKIVD